MPASPARRVAFTVLLRVERESAYAVELLHSSLLDDLSQADSNLATAIVMGVLRWRSWLDALIVPLLNQGLSRLDLEVLTALRMAAYQLAFLSRIPGRAIVNESVELVRFARKSSAAGLVNAVLRKLETQHPRPPAAEEEISDPARALAHPGWLVERWIAKFGVERAVAICRYDQQTPRTMLRVSRGEDEAILRQQGIELAPGAFMRHARVAVSGDVTRTPLFRDGLVAIQDEGSQLAAALVGQGKRILDCCAAPGSKTAALAAASPDAEIYAAELHPHRARLLRRMAPQENVHVVTADALQLPFSAAFDRVLADVPCSGTGTLARNPEIKWRLKPEDLTDLQSKQKSILQAGMRHVQPGGRLIYSTCSLEQEENEDVVQSVLGSTSGFELLPVREELIRLQEKGQLVWKNVDELVSGSFLRTIPGVHPCDGFFAAILRKAAG